MLQHWVSAWRKRRDERTLQKRAIPDELWQLTVARYPFISRRPPADIAALRDPRHAFAAKSRVRVTPEVAVYGRAGELLYHGRIDDRYADLGKARPAPTSRDLQSALVSLVSGKAAKPPSGPAVGCFIEELR